MENKLAVILPVYNSQSTILRAAQSILDSDFDDFELLIVDDGSTDNTYRQVASLNDRRVRVLRKKHEGVVSTFNVGLRNTQARWIARMDADDVSTADRLGKQLSVLQSDSVDVVGGKVKILDFEGTPVPSMLRYETWINSLIDATSISAFRFVESPIVQPTVMARREVFELGYRDGPWPEDYDLWLRAMRQGFRFAKIADLVLTWTDHNRRLTRSDARYSPEAFDRCRQMHLLEGPLKGIPSVRLWGAGKTGKPWLRWFRSNNIAVHTLIDVSQRKIGEMIHGVRVSAPDDLPRADNQPLIVAVGAEGARELILNHIKNLGYVPGENTWFLA